MIYFADDEIVGSKIINTILYHNNKKYKVCEADSKGIYVKELIEWGVFCFGNIDLKLLNSLDVDAHYVVFQR